MATKFRIPHTLTLLSFMMGVALVATWVIPQGRFQTEVTPSGRAAVVPGTFARTPDPVWLSPLELFTAIPRAFASAQDIIFFLLIVGGVLAILRRSGAVDALLGKLLERFSTRPTLLIATVVGTFAAASSVMGASGEYIPFVLLLVALCRALKMDALTAVGMIVAGYGIGYGVAAFNPYTVVVAQGIAGLPTYSGWGVRLLLLIPFVAIGVHHVRSYAERVRLDPERSLVRDLEDPAPASAGITHPAMSGTHLTILATFLLGLGIAVWGIATRGWYLTELGAAFLGIGVVTALLGRIGPSETAQSFIQGARDLSETALLVGVARGIALVLEDGQILHTIVHGLSLPLAQLGPELAAVGMLGIQTILNFFVPSGSGQAFVTMPLMAPVGDLVGVSRQVSVLAFQFGDGFANILVPTNPVLMGILGMAGIPFDRWVRFCAPLLLKLMGAAAATLVILVWSGGF
jgi:uncharacterized ion transporter superfamily protein YfcC